QSAFALVVALRVAQQGTGVAFLSGEMDEERLMERALAIEGRVAVDELRTAKMNDLTRAGIGAAAVRLRGLPLSLLPLAADVFETMAARLDPLRQLGLVVLDYLQLVPAPTGAARSTQDEEVALVLRQLKALALERQVALVVAAQLPHFDAQREHPRPTLDDFGHLGAVKQHADVVLAIYRAEMYHPGGGVDPAGNARLRTAIEAAKAENMPWDNIDRAIKKGAGGLDGVQYEEVAYEGYGPGGAAILIQATTDNANRTVAEIRHLFTRYGG